jgi:phage terminase Nu1 subunit (DNA packaging protein)
MTETAIERDLDAIRWYVSNLNDVIARKRVRGLDEAEAGYRRAMDRLSRMRSALAKADAEVAITAQRASGSSGRSEFRS